jgi:hypothetical protein
VALRSGWVLAKIFSIGRLIALQIWRISAERQRARRPGQQEHELGKNPFQLGGSFAFCPGNVELYMSGSHRGREFLLSPAHGIHNPERFCDWAEFGPSRREHLGTLRDVGHRHKSRHDLSAP